MEISVTMPKVLRRDVHAFISALIVSDLDAVPRDGLGRGQIRDTVYLAKDNVSKLQGGISDRCHGHELGALDLSTHAVSAGSKSHTMASLKNLDRLACPTSHGYLSANLLLE